MAEQDLSHIIGQVQALRQQDTRAGQVDAEYRAAITNHVNGLLAICNQPDIRDIVVLNIDNPTSAGYIDLAKDTSVSVQQLVKNLDGIGVAELQMMKSPNGYVFFALAIGSPDPELKSMEQLLGAVGIPSKDARFGKLVEIVQNRRAIFEQKVAPGLANLMSIASNRWIEVLDQAEHFYFGLPLTPEEFIQHPEWLQKFDEAVMTLLTDAHGRRQTRMQGQQERITEFGSTPLARVIEQLQTNSAAYSPSQLHEVAQNAAETVVQQTTGVSEQRVVQIVGEMLEQRLAALQVPPDGRIVSILSPQVEQQINQAARGDMVVESMFRRFVRRSKDPERATQALLALAGVIPGAQQLQAILQALNLYFGPEETTI